MIASTNSKRGLLFEQFVVILTASIACAIVQYLFLKGIDIDSPQKIWRIPSEYTNNGFCIKQVCGGPSLLLLYGAPVIGAICSFLYAILKKAHFDALAENGAFDRLDDPLFQLQSAFVVIGILANAFLGGALITWLVGEIRGFAPLILIQTALLSLSFISLMLSIFSAYATGKLKAS